VHPQLGAVDAVDVVEPNEDAVPRRFFIEDADTESLIGYASSYKAAAHKFARHHGIADPQIAIDYEYRH